MNLIIEQHQSIKQLFIQANHARLKGNSKLAAQLYNKILRIKPDSAAALHDLGLLLLENGQADKACAAIKQAIKLFPQDSNYYYHLAEALRACEKPTAAIEAYKQALAIQADISDYYFGLGNAYSEVENYTAALNAYQQVIQLNPNDSEALNNLGNTLYKLGQNNQSIVYYKKALKISPEFAQAHYNLSVSLKLEDQLQKSLNHAQKAIALAPAVIEYYLNLAELYYQLGDYPNSLKQYRRVLDIDIEHPIALSGYAKVLTQSGDAFAAISYFEQALKQSPDDINLSIEMTSCLIRLQRFSTAKNILENLLDSHPEEPRALFNYALCQQAQGQFQQALKAHKKCLSLDPQITQAAYHIACNGNFNAANNEVKKLKSQLSESQLSIEKQTHLYFALAKHLERLEDYDQAFKYFKFANSLKAQKQPFNPERHLDYINRLKKIFTKQFFTQRKDYGLSNKQLVFIIGMPRSGSTLVEQILASHRDVYALGESLAMPTIVKHMPARLNSSLNVPECVLELSKDQSRVLANEYMDYLPRNSHKQHRLTDKMLGNFLRLGFIALLFPQSRIINCQRMPLDTCLSCYTQDFAHGLRFTTSMKHLGVFYNSYLQLMKHWQRHLPLEILNMQYEHLVLDKQAVIWELLDFCRLSHDSRCLDFNQTERSVSTASFWQARQPIYKHSIGRWTNYQNHLRPLINSLSVSNT